MRGFSFQACCTLKELNFLTESNTNLSSPSFKIQIDVLDVKAQTPLFTAVSGKHLDCVAALLKAGADPNGSQYNNCSPVLTAAREGDVDVLRELLRFEAEVDVRPKVPEWASNATACRGPLYISAVYGHLSCFKLLLLHGANPNYNCTDEKMLARIKQPKTVVEVCLRYGCGVEYMQLLVDFGADVYLPTLIIDKTTKQNEALLLLLRERGESDTCSFRYDSIKYVLLQMVHSCHFYPNSLSQNTDVPGSAGNPKTRPVCRQGPCNRQFGHTSGPEELLKAHKR